MGSNRSAKHMDVNFRKELNIAWTPAVSDHGFPV